MYLFLLGRDRDLSKLELAICLNKNKVNYSVVIETDEYLILDINKNQNYILEITKSLSGLIRIAKVYLKTKKLTDEIINKLDWDCFNKFNYTISFIDLDEKDIDVIESFFKQHFKFEKVKAVYKKPISNPKKQKIMKNISNPDNFYSWKIDCGLEVFVIKNKEFYFSKTIFCSNPKEFIIKDKKRPVIKEKYSTSFRLTSIMVNLLGLEEGKTIVDPFCGVGTFLIEGLIKGYDVIGIDKDKEMVYASNKNLIWASSFFKTKNKFKIIEGDSAKVSFTAQGCVFEPYMGAFIKKLPSNIKAKKTIKELNKVYDEVFRNLNKCLDKNSKVVCILPEFKTIEQNLVKINKDVFLKNGFKYVDVSVYNSKISIKNPIHYSTPDGSIINRTINILEKRK